MVNRQSVNLILELYFGRIGMSTRGISHYNLLFFIVKSDVLVVEL